MFKTGFCLEWHKREEIETRVYLYLFEVAATKFWQILKLLESNVTSYL